MPGRQPRSVEFFQQLSKVLGLTGGPLAKRVGKKPANVSAYLSGAKVPQKKALSAAMRHAFEWEVTPAVEVREHRQ